jgi:uracil-DNA glycosylase family 4
MDEPSLALAVARQLVAQRLESLERAGAEQIGKVPMVSNSRTLVGGAAPATASVRPVPPAPPPHASQDATMPRIKPAPPLAGVSRLAQSYPADLPSDAAGRRKLLDELNDRVRGCKLCALLAKSRTQTVFGVGNPLARVVFFGEAPGADEDRLGEPFVGRAGQLLTKIIEACTWKREDVYIMNVLKCRPPDNRNPDPEETAHCRPFFERQFEVLRPEYIVCVGTVPGQALLETTEPVGKLRGRFHRYRDSKVLVTYHPSYLLRNPAAKKYVWDDMQILLKDMGIAVPKRGS